MTRIALATCENLPDWEVDDRPLFDALERREVTLAHPAWSDPNVDWASFDACLIRTTWDYQERLPEFLEWAERISAQTRLFNPLSIIQWNTHKSYLRDLETGGARTVPTIWLTAGDEVQVRDVMDGCGWSRGFIKPAVGATARETLRFSCDPDGLAEATAHLERLLPHEDLLLQPYLDTVETAGEWSALFFGGAFSHAVRKIPVEGDYRVQDDFGATDEPYVPSDVELDEARAIVGLVPADLLYARVDFLRDHEGHSCVTELELVEPSLFLRHDASAADRLADALCRRLTESAVEGS